ncbi:hypothetical protein D9M72_14390 [compost metagenome]
MSGQQTLQELDRIVGATNELLLSPEVKMMDVGGGVMRPTNALVMTNLATLLGGAMPYASVALGLAGTADGTNFSVLSSADDEYVSVYRNEGGSAELVDSYPNAKATRYGITQADLALELSPSRMLSSDFASAQVDEYGTPILGVKKSGVAFGLFDELPGLFFLSGEWRYVHVDEDGVILFGQRWNGTTLVYGVTSGSDASAYLVNDSGQSDVWLHAEGADFQITTSGSNWDPSVSDGLVRYLSRVGVNVQRVQEELPAVNQLAAYIRKILHIPSHGQSLSLGVHSVIQTTQPPVANRAFTIAVGLRQSDSLQAATLAPESVLPLKSLVSNLQEAPHAQLCAGLSRHRDLPADAGIVGSCHGVGATTILGLSKGTVSYNNLITAVTQCKADATARGLEYSVPYVDWIQGEANSAGSQGNYLAALIQLQADLTADIGAISGDGNVPLVLCQMSSWTTKNITTSYVPLEQLQAALENPDKFYCAGPKYWLDYHTDGVHLTGKGSVQLAAMHRAAGAAAVARSEGGEATTSPDWFPTHCTKAVRSGSTVTLTFHTPEGPLVKDTVNVTDPGSLGIRWIDSTSSASVTAVAVNDDNTVTLTLSTVPTGSSPRVGIADIGISGALGGPTTGPRACLRDSNTELDGMGNPFYNWACHQIISVE